MLSSDAYLKARLSPSAVGSALSAGSAAGSAVGSAGTAGSSAASLQEHSISAHISIAVISIICFLVFILSPL